jgi:hypothetical protein
MCASTPQPAARNRLDRGPFESANPILGVIIALDARPSLALDSVKAQPSLTERRTHHEVPFVAQHRRYGERSFDCSGIAIDSGC